MQKITVLTDLGFIEDIRIDDPFKNLNKSKVKEYVENQTECLHFTVIDFKLEDK